MAAAPITRENGQLIVPPNPIVPVCAGDGVGPETFAAARRVIDSAVAKAFKSTRKIEWLELPAGQKALASTGASLPKATLDAFTPHLVSMLGPFVPDEKGGTPALALRRALSLGPTQAVVRTIRGAPGAGGAKVNARIWWDALEHAANPIDLPAGMPLTSNLLRALRERSPDVFLRLRFGSRERVESYLRSAARKESPLVELALSVQPVSWPGAHRLAMTALRAALADRRKRVTVVHRTATSPQVEGAFRDWVMRVADEDLAEECFSSNAYVRIALQAGEAAADEYKALVEREGQAYVEEASFDEALATVLDRPESLDVVIATADTAASFVPLVAAHAGGSTLVPVASYSREHGRASFGVFSGPAVGDQGQDRASAAGFLLAGEQLLRHLGWTEAANRVLGAVESALAQGRLPPDLGRFAPGATRITAGQWADAAAAAV